MIALGVLILAGLVGAEPAQENELVSYAEAVQCAGLTQAASELEGGESVEGKRLYDAALYWSLAAMQAATTAGKSAQAAEGDQTRARIAAVRRLSAEGPRGRAFAADADEWPQRSPSGTGEAVCSSSARIYASCSPRRGRMTISAGSS